MRFLLRFDGGPKAIPNPRSPQYANTTQQFADQPDLIDRIANALPRGTAGRLLPRDGALPLSARKRRDAADSASHAVSELADRTGANTSGKRARATGRSAVGRDCIITATHQAGVAYQKQLEARLSKLPEEIAQGISADAIAAKVSEHLRQQIQETGLPGLADAIGVQAAGLRKAGKELSVALDEFSSPRHGAVPVLNKELASMKTSLGNASDHIRVQMNGLGKELWRSMAVVSAGTLAVGFIGGILYHQWITSPVEPSSASTPQVQFAPSPGPRTWRPS